MHDFDLSALAVRPVTGDDVYGGRIGLGAVGAIIGIIAFLDKEWPEIKRGLSDGWNNQ
jgi:hypothetical protein